MKMHKVVYDWETKRRFFCIDKYDSISFRYYTPDTILPYMVMSNNEWSLKSYKYDIIMDFNPKTKRLVVTPSIISQKARQLY